MRKLLSIFILLGLLLSFFACGKHKDIDAATQDSSVSAAPTDQTPTPTTSAMPDDPMLRSFLAFQDIEAIDVIEEVSEDVANWTIELRLKNHDFKLAKVRMSRYAIPELGGKTGDAAIKVVADFLTDGGKGERNYEIWMYEPYAEQTCEAVFEVERADQKEQRTIMIYEAGYLYVWRPAVFNDEWDVEDLLLGRWVWEHTNGMDNMIEYTETYWVYNQERVLRDPNAFLTTYETRDGIYRWVYDMPVGAKGAAMTIDVREAPDEDVAYFCATVCEHESENATQTIPLLHRKRNYGVEHDTLSFADLNQDGYMDIRESDKSVWIWNPKSGQFEQDLLLYWNYHDEETLKTNPDVAATEERIRDREDRYPRSREYWIRLYDGSPRTRIRVSVDVPHSYGADLSYFVEVFEKPEDEQPIDTFYFGDYGGYPSLEFFDINFDGYMDIETTPEYGASGGLFKYYIWNPKSKSYAFGASFESQGGVGPDFANQLILNYEHASGVSGYDTMHKWFGVEVRKVRSMYHFDGWDETSGPYFRVEYYPDGKEWLATTLYEGEDEEKAEEAYLNLAVIPTND